MGVSGCSHGCENTWGGFTCTCPQGYTLDTDRKICKSKQVDYSSLFDAVIVITVQGYFRPV